MSNYTAVSKLAGSVHFMAENNTAAKNWVINHLDLSLNWNIYRV